MSTSVRDGKMTSVLRIRDYKREDAAKIDEIYDRCHAGTFAIPDLNKVLASVVVEYEDRIVAYGANHTILESTMILDLDMPQAVKVSALKHLMFTAETAAKMNKYDRLYAFPSTMPFSNILEKHFCFDKTGPILVLQLEDVLRG